MPRTLIVDDPGAPDPTSDPVEVRLMVDQCDDNIATDRMELFVR